MVKVLFLDIDGVILDMNYLHDNHEDGPWTLNPEKLNILHEILNKTGAKIVISSSWRLLEEGMEYLEKYLGSCMHLNNKTPINNNYEILPDGTTSKIYLGKIRGDEIKAWLDKHPEITTYAILDDDSDMLFEQKPFFVKTDTMKGLERFHIDFLVEILGEK